MGAEPTRTGGTYRPVCELAAGGVGRVDLVVREEGRFRRLYALKRLRESYRDDPDVRTMFLDEARIAGLLRHPNVVSVLDVGEDASGPFLVMDYVEGVSVAALIERAARDRSEIPLQVCLRIAIGAAEGLHAAHELRDARGRPLELVHRDVSPQNVLVGFDGIARVTDFGIAKAIGRTTRTETGVLKGKLGYMSPEQLRFEEPDRRSDLFSLGVVLFELLAGERLYRNVEGMDGVRRILNEPPPDIGDRRDDVPPELVQLLFSMLAKNAAHRPPDARAVARALEELLAALVAEEGRIEVAEQLTAAFAEERRAQADRIASAIASATGITATAKATAAPALPSVRPRPRPRAALFAALGAVALAAAAAVAWWQLAGGDAPASSDRSRPIAPVETAGNVEPDEPEGRAEPTAPLASPTAPVEPAAAPSSTAVRPASGVTDAPASAGPGAERTRRRPRPARPGGSSRTGVPMWSWQ